MAEPTLLQQARRSLRAAGYWVEGEHLSAAIEFVVQHLEQQQAATSGQTQASALSTYRIKFWAGDGDYVDRSFDVRALTAADALTQFRARRGRDEVEVREIAPLAQVPSEPPADDWDAPPSSIVDDLRAALDDVQQSHADACDPAKVLERVRFERAMHQRACATSGPAQTAPVATEPSIRTFTESGKAGDFVAMVPSCDTSGLDLDELQRLCDAATSDREFVDRAQFVRVALPKLIAKVRELQAEVRKLEGYRTAMEGDEDAFALEHERTELIEVEHG